MTIQINRDILRAMNIAQFKSHYYSGAEIVHLNNSGQSLIPDVYRDLAHKWIDRLYLEGALCSMEGWAQTDVTRKKLAKFLGADEAEVSFFTTTSSALSQAALGIPLKANDEILTWEQEYPSNFYPWRLAAEKAKAKIIQIESDNFETPVEKILKQVTAKTKVIAISWVQYQTGSVTDLKTISDQLKGKDIWLVADVIQGVGVRPFNFHESGFDIVCGGSHKFMCSGYGAGFMVMKKEKLEQVNPIEVGAMTYGFPETEKSFSIEPRTDSKRFEPGSKAMVEVIAMSATLDLFSEVGISNIYKEASRLSNRLANGLRDVNFDVISPEGPILNCSPKGGQSLAEVAQKLNHAKISFALRGPGIRLSTHAYNRDSEIDRVLEIMGK